MAWLAPTIIGVAAVIIGFFAGHFTGNAEAWRDIRRERRAHTRKPVTPKA